MVLFWGSFRLLHCQPKILNNRRTHSSLQGTQMVTYSGFYPAEIIKPKITIDCTGVTGHFGVLLLGSSMVHNPCEPISHSIDWPGLFFFIMMGDVSESESLRRLRRPRGVCRGENPKRQSGENVWWFLAFLQLPNCFYLFVCLYHYSYLALALPAFGKVIWTWTQS